MGNCPKKRNIANMNALIAGLRFSKVISENDKLLGNRKNSLYEPEPKASRTEQDSLRMSLHNNNQSEYHGLYILLRIRREREKRSSLWRHKLWVKTR